MNTDVSYEYIHLSHELSIFHTTSKRESSVQNGGRANVCEMMHASK